MITVNTQDLSDEKNRTVEQEQKWQTRPLLLPTTQMKQGDRGSKASSLEPLLWLDYSSLPSATAYNLSLVPWDFIGALTFGCQSLRGQTREAADRRQGLYRRWLAEICKCFRLRLRNLSDYTKTEYGTDSDNPHFHLLIRFQSPRLVSRKEVAATAKQLWTESSPWRDAFGSINDEWQAKIVPFLAENGQRGIDYVTKDEVDRYGNLRVPEETLSKRLKREIRQKNTKAAREIKFAC